jgi:glutaconate CoA-transferase subunit A
MTQQLDKRMSVAEVVGQLKSGMTIGIGGWGPRRKPMALVREILRSDLTDLTIVGYGGPDMGMLCAAGKVKKLVYGFVSMDFIPLEPFFRLARERGEVAGASLEVMELDEGLLNLGLRAAGMRVPFLPTRVGLGTDLMTHNPEFRLVRSPYADEEALLAMPAIELDVALLHVDYADLRGNTQIHGPDPFFDEQMARAAQRTFVSAEYVVDTLEDQCGQVAKTNYFERSMVSGVVHVPGGAHPTSCTPQYGWDAAHLKDYVAAASEENGWQRYAGQYLGADEADYRQRIGGLGAIRQLPLPTL